MFRIAAILLFTLIITTFSCTPTTEKVVTTSIKTSLKDSIQVLIMSAKNKQNPNREKEALLAVALAEKSEIDSLWFKSQHRLSIVNFQEKNYEAFKSNSQRYLSRATILKDSLYMAKGNYKIGSYYLKTSVYDSAYYYFNQAVVFYITQKDSLNVGANLLNMAIIQKTVGDYYGSENTSTDALKYLHFGINTKYILAVYNNLGIVCDELGQYTDALYWYNKALDYTVKDKECIIIENNIGVAQRNLQKYALAALSFEKALQENDINKDPLTEAMILDNLGYLKILKKEADALPLLEDGYMLRKKHNSIRGQAVSSLRLGKYYQNISPKKANYYFKKALELSTSISDIKNQLKALSFLLDISSDKGYSFKYREITDSITRKERVLKHQFAKVRYRTKEQELKNLELFHKNTQQSLQLSKQKSNTTLMLILVSGMVLFIAFWFYYQGQQKKLAKQKHIIEKLQARSEEKQRISMYLHDDIASDLLIGIQQSDVLQKQIQREDFEKTISIFERAYDKISDISHNLSLQKFKSISLSKRVEKLCKEITFSRNIQVTYQGLDLLNKIFIEDAIKAALFSILKEAFSNILKHAKPSEASINFSIHKNTLSMRIIDNGKGIIDSQNTGIGILNMKKRTEDMGGRFNITNISPKGTQLIISIPDINEKT